MRREGRERRRKLVITALTFHLPLLDVHAVGHVEERKPLRSRNGRGRGEGAVAERFQERQREAGTAGTEEGAASWGVHGFEGLDSATGGRIRWNGTLSQVASTIVWNPRLPAEARPVISRTAVLS